MNSPRVLLYYEQASGEVVNSFRSYLLENFAILEHCSASSHAENDLQELVNLTRTNVVDLILLVLSRVSTAEDIALVRRICSHPETLPPVVACIAEDHPRSVLEILTAGAADFIAPPLTRVNILPRLWRLVSFTRQDEAAQNLKVSLGLRHLLGTSPLLLDEIQKLPKVSRSDASVLISGETGTGKSAVARSIHYLGPRAEKPFVPVSCGAIPNELAEAEFFGHARGAFTGAEIERPGLVQAANGGTLFLDDVDCLSMSVQMKLLRLLQEKEYRSVGSSQNRIADVRFIAATNVPLEGAVEKGTFRKDLYYRLNVISLKLPPLRDRREDIPLLARHFVQKHSRENPDNPYRIVADAMQRLVVYSWPGNVRQLENTIAATLALCTGTVIGIEDLQMPCEDSANDEPFHAAKARVVAQFELHYIKGLLATYDGNISKAARAAHKNRRTFWELMRKHKIDATCFRPHL